MDMSLVVDAIDAELERLREARALLSGIRAEQPTTESVAPAQRTRRRRRKLSAEARRRIAEAQKKRWAAVWATEGIPKPKAPKRATKRASA